MIKQGLMCVSYCILVLQNGETALMLAARCGCSETVKALIEAGADITIRNEVSSWNQPSSIISKPPSESRDCPYAGCTRWTC